MLVQDLNVGLSKDNFSGSLSLSLKKAAQMKAWKITFYILAITPWPFIGSLMAFYIHATKILGYGPSYDMPDRGTLAISRYYSPYIDYTGSVWIWSFMAWLTLGIAYLAIKRKQVEWRPVIVGAIGQFFAVCLLFSGIMEWYLD